MNSEIINFNNLDLKVNLNIDCIPHDNKKLLYNYISQLTDVEKFALKIAYEHLGSSFNILKSCGYKKWLSNL